MILTSSSLRLQIEPACGAGIARFDWIANDASVPLMRPYEPRAAGHAGMADANQLACYPLLPWSNRISGGGFSIEGRRVEVARNRADEAWPIHGTGWQRAWRVEHASESEALLGLEEAVAAPYQFRAALRYAIRGSVLDVTMDVTNTGASALPFGLGLHPYFPRHDGVRLAAPARGIWINDGRTPLPVERTAVPEQWNFASETDTPAGLDHCFDGWNGRASIRWPQQGLRLELSADVERYIVYAPAQRDFFCFEPVDHCIDAVNQPGGAVANGMTMLAPGQMLTRHFTFRATEDS